jgi:copper(I)-binding protein
MNVQAMLVGLSLIFGSGAVAAAPACAPKFEQAWIRAAPPGTTALAAYGQLRNNCPKPFVVEGVASDDFAMGMIHETRVHNGVSQMRAAENLALPARGQIVFAPGGRHMMLMHPMRELKVGDRVWLELTLAGGARVRAQFEVRRQAPVAPKG